MRVYVCERVCLNSTRQGCGSECVGAYLQCIHVAMHTRCNGCTLQCLHVAMHTGCKAYTANSSVIELVEARGERARVCVCVCGTAKVFLCVWERVSAEQRTSLWELTCNLIDVAVARGVRECVCVKERMKEIQRQSLMVCREIERG